MLTWKERSELEQRWFTDARTHVWRHFRSELAQHVHSQSMILDAGSGKGSWFLRRHKGRAHMIVGMDIVTPSQFYLDAFVQGSLESLPFPDGAFDIIVCDDVIEHLSQPQRVFSEFARVLRPPSAPRAQDGGVLIFKTPSLWAPTTLVARLLPFSLHQGVKRFLGVPEDDVYPTQYQCNTPKALDSSLRACGLEKEWLDLADGTYGYAAFNHFSYVLGLLYSRLTYHSFLKPIRSIIVGAYRRAG